MYCIIRYTFTLLLILLLGTNTRLLFSAEISSVTPDFIKMRHAAKVEVAVKNFDNDLHLSVIPGGAFVKKSKTVSPLSILHKNLLISVEDKFSIVIYQANKSSWQEIGFIEIESITEHQPIIALSLSKNRLRASTKNKIIEININQPALPQIVSHTAITKITSTEKPSISVNQFTLSLSAEDGIQVWKNAETNSLPVSQYKSNTISRDIILADKLIAVADGTTGITLLSLSPKGDIQWQGSYNKLGNIIHVAYADGHLLAADDKGVLSVFDISNPATPLLISDFHTHRPITSVQFHNKQAYVLTDDGNIKKIINVDFSANSSPMISTLGVNQGGSRRSFIDNDILYVADWFSGLHLYDIRNPNILRLLSSFPTPGSPKGVVVQDGVAFVADDDHGLQVIDVSNPRDPAFISEIPLSGLAYTMKLVNKLLYIASHRGGFHIVDVSNPASPVLIGSYDTPSKAWALAFQNGLLYVADDSSGLMVFDVTKPSQPKLINQFSPAGYAGTGFAEDVILKDNKAYIAFFDLGLFIVDITDPLNLKQLAHLPTPGNARGIEIKDDLLYLASWEAGVQIINIASDTNPHIVGHYDTKGAVWGLSVKDKVIYAMDWWGGVKVIDAKQTDKPHLIAQYQTAGLINGLQYHKRFIYSAHGSRGLQVYDASNDLNPVWATGVDINGEAKSVVINQDQAIPLAIVAAGDGGIAIVDISNPFQSRLSGQLKLPAAVSLVETQNTLIFAAEKNGDLFLVDMQNPRAPVLLKRISSRVNQLAIYDGKLFVLHNNHTLSSYSVEKLTGNAPEHQYTLPTKSDGFQFLDKNRFILRAQNQLISCTLSAGGIQCLNHINIPANFIAMHLRDNQLYTSTTDNDLYVFNIETNNAIKLNTIYPTSHRITEISTSKGGIFFGGENIIASAKLLPALNIQKHNDYFTIHIPNNMPKGAYHLALTHPNGKQSIRKNALIIGFPKLKSKFTLEQLKAIMKQKNFDGKAPKTP